MTPQKNPPKVVRANGNGKPAFVTANGKTQIVDWAEFLGGISRGKAVLEYGANRRTRLVSIPMRSRFDQDRFEWTVVFHRSSTP